MARRYGRPPRAPSPRPENARGDRRWSAENRMRAHSYVELPAGWRRASSSGPGPFVTREELVAPDGRVVPWRSRAHRKARAPSERQGVWWRPDRIGWWMGVLFAVGSACFAVASVVSQ